MKELDKIDKQLLSELQKNCTQSIRELSDKIHQPMSTVHNRLKQFKQAGMIKAFNAVVNDEKLGTYVTALILVDTRKMSKTSLDAEGIAIKISAMPHVQECHVLQGTYDIAVKVKAPAMADIRDISKKISSLEGVADLDVFIALRTVRETSEISL